MSLEASELGGLLRRHEDWLMGRILEYATELGYVRYTSTLREAWRLSIAGLTASIAAALEEEEGGLELDPEETYERDPAASFGVLEAKRHRERGVPLPMFLGLFKYYRQSYLDLLEARADEIADLPEARRAVVRCFDRFEIAFNTEWAGKGGGELLDELRGANRRAVNEKNAYLTVFESLRDPAILLDREGRVTALNHATALLLDPEAIPGALYYRVDDLPTDVGRRVGPGGAGNAAEALGAPLATAFPWLAESLGPGLERPEAREVVEATLQVGDDRRAFDVVASRMLDVSGKFGGTVVSLRDVTAQRGLEEERRRLQVRALEAQRLESLALLAGGVAHDFNNLLTGVVAAASLAKEDAEPGSDLESLLEIVESSAARASDLARQMLAYSGRGHFVMAPVSLGAVVAGMDPLLKTLITVRRTLELRLDEDAPQTLADEVQVRQIVLALAANAAEAYGDGPGAITIAVFAARVEGDGGPTSITGEPLPPGAYVCLEVRDLGAGIQPSALGRIFDPFYSTKGTGRGLGLSAVQGIVRGHSGGIEVRSSPGEGTTVRVLLPKAEAPRRTVAPEERRVAPARGATLLVVDDEAAVRDVARRLLERAGYRVLVARDGEEALEVAAAEPSRIDGALLDWTMPRRSGLETLRALRGARGDLPMVIMSGYRAEVVAEELEGEEVAGVLPKPFGREDLLAAVASAIDRGSGPSRPSGC